MLAGRCGIAAGQSGIRSSSPALGARGARSDIRTAEALLLLHATASSFLCLLIIIILKFDPNWMYLLIDEQEYELIVASLTHRWWRFRWQELTEAR
jgi:hypothetical protein